MPEIKNNFTGGKMNKDLDERLMPNGQYRDALNVEVSTSEGSNVGTVQNILGNKRVEDVVGSNFTCVGSIADEKTNKLYWFISRYDKDVILEYDLDNDIASPVLVDLKAGTDKAVLKFFGNIITGINIINNLLFWTDDKGEPKKINITECKKGTPNFNTHTQLSFEQNSFVGIAAEYLWPSKMPDFDTATGSEKYGVHENNHPPKKPYKDMLKSGKYIAFQRRRLCAMLGYEFDELVDQYGNIKDANNHYLDSSVFDAPGNLINSGTGTNSFGNSDNPGYGYVFNARHYRDGNLLGVRQIKAWDNGNGTHLRYNSGPNNTDPAQRTSDINFRKGDVIFGVNIKSDIEEKHVTVLKPKPTKELSIKINYEESSNSTNKIPNLFETKFPRFSYRYKFRDGEFSAMAPFTQPVFNPQYTKDTSSSLDANILYNKDNVYDVKDPHNKAMINSIHSVDLMNFITIDTPEDVVEVDMLYKQEDSPVVYSIGTVKHTDYEWHASLNYENLNLHINGMERYAENIDSTQAHYRPHMPASHGDLTSGNYVVTTENIHAALPANQLLRPWDNVPRKARAQEVVGNRIVYGNYLQNYTVGSNPQVFVSYKNRKKLLSDFDVKGLPSIKSQRNYQVGVVYVDEFGRETPVFTSNSGAVYLPWQDANGNKNASKSNQLIASTPSNFPDWVDSIKFFVKENSSEYYNLSMQRAWTAKSVYELDNDENHLWISFPSSDRNKVSEEDYIVLKKKIGANENQVTFENKFKVVDIKNEAPEAIKYRLVNLGVVDNSNNGLTSDYTASTSSSSITVESLFYKAAHRPDKPGHDQIIIRKAAWINNNSLYDVNRVPIFGTEMRSDRHDVFASGDLYLSWFRLDTNGAVQASSKYRVSGGWAGTEGYVLNLENKIKEKDADIAHIYGSSVANQNEDDLHPDLRFQIERKTERTGENFSGQFFVKISKNQITQKITEGNEVQEFNNFQVKSSLGAWYWQDDVDGTTTNNANNPHKFGSGQPYGATNYFGYPQTKLADNDVQRTGGGNTNSNGANPQGTARLTDWHVMWENILGELNNNSNGTRFFVDAMHMASGQSGFSDLAKYNCITWSGSTYKNATPFGDIPVSRNSSWSYPPVKKWWTEITENELEATKRETSAGGAIYTTGGAVGSGFASTVFNLANNLNQDIITTSHLFDQSEDWTYFDDSDPDGSNHVNVGMQIDGFVGPSQRVGRNNQTNEEANNHINCLEGFVTTNEYHTNGPRRWMSGMDGQEYGVGQNTNTYGVGPSNNSDSDVSEEGKHFMHLSFFAPGKDLHDNTSWHFPTNNTIPILYGEDTFMDNLQGIWGGGVFNGRRISDKFGSDSDDSNKYYHLPMEGNYASGEDKTYKVYREAPGPGVGYGYDLKYRELHERQWDPTFTEDGDPDNKIRDFIRNLHPGSKFIFHHKDHAQDGASAFQDKENIYTIKKVHIKKLYNHTNWRSHYNIYWNSNGGYHYNDVTQVPIAYRSVEDVALLFLNTIDAAGKTSESVSDAAVTSYSTTSANTFNDLKKKIVDFGAAHNRRLCYVVELDKNPTDSSYNPIDNNVVNEEGMCGDLDSDNFTHIEFLEPVQDMLLSDLNKFPAIWELSPKKKDVDLDIYYEASGNIPVRLNRHTNTLFAPKGCVVEIINNPYNNPDIDEVYLVEWNDNVATFEPGFLNGDGVNQINYDGLQVKFLREDGSYTIAELSQQQPSPAVTGMKTKFSFKPSISSSQIEVGLSWFNCFSFGNGLESNRIRDDFNEMFITNGVKASTTLQETYKEENRSSGLIFSGLYNSNSGINDLNQFIMAEKITKDLNPTYGSIQKLFTRNSDLVAFCEDKVVKVLANKDAVFNADGNPQLTANENVLGQSIPFAGEYGISKNPESFASESFRAYFTDKQRGAVLRLSMDGLTPISKAGMHDWFRDNLQKYTSLIGTYDSYKEDYNITLSNTYTENIIFNTYFQLGAESQPLDLESLNLISNGGISQGANYSHSYESTPFPNSSTYNFVPESDPSIPFISNVTITNHPEIPMGHFQQEQIGAGSPDPAIVATAYTVQEGVVIGVNYAQATYSLRPLDSSSLVFNGFISYPGPDIFGPSRAGNFGVGDKDYFTIKRFCGALSTVVEIDEDNTSATDFMANPFADSSASWGTDDNPEVEKTIQSYPAHPSSSSSMTFNTHVKPKVSGAITRDKNSNFILFDRTHPSSYVLFEDLGVGSTADSGNTLSSGGVNSLYATNAGLTPASSNGIFNNSCYNGDEIHIQVKVRCWKDVKSSDHGYYSRWGYNRCQPKITLTDNGVDIPDSKFVLSPGSGSNVYTDAQSDSTTVNFAKTTGYISASDGGYVDGNTGITYSNNVSYGNANDFPGNHWCNVRGYGGGNYHAPNVKYMYTVQHTHSSSSAGNFDVLYGISVKFRDPNQQNSDGSYSGNGDGITDVRVVENLGVKIHRGGSATGLGPQAGTSGVYPMGRSLFAVKEVKVEKGFGIDAPHVASVAADPGITVTYYDDPTTGGQDGLTVSQIQAGGGAWDPTVNGGAGGWVLNYDDIQNYINSPSGGAYYHPNVPAVTVPAWVEVEHNSDNWNFNVGSNGVSGGIDMVSKYRQANTTSFFGNNRGGTDVSVQLAAQGDSTGNYTGPVVSWKEPGATQDPNPQEGNYGNSPGVFDKVFSDVDGVPITPPPLGTLTASGSNPGQTTYNFKNSWATFKHLPAAVTAANNQGSFVGAYGITFDNTSDPFEVGEWYIVDVYLDPTEHPEILINPSAGGVGPTAGDHWSGSGIADNGVIAVRGVTGVSITTGYNLNQDGGYGFNAGGSADKHAMTIKHWKTEYGSTDQWVYRAIFKIESDSWVITSAGWDEKINIRFYQFVNERIYVRSILAKKISFTNDTGTASNWLRGIYDGNGDRHEQINTFTNSNMYYHTGHLCWNNLMQTGNYPWSTLTAEHIWSQDLTNSPALNQGDNWILKFELTDEPRTGVFDVTDFGFIITGDSTDYANYSGTGTNFTGVRSYNINQKGVYEVEFKLDGTGPVGNMKLDGVEDASIITEEYGTTGTMLYGTGENKIAFLNNSASSPMTCGLKNVFLTQSNTIFQGGQAGSWNFDGFDSITDTYITWDVYWPSGQVGTSGDGRIQFKNAPKIDPNYGAGNIIVSANQYIDHVVNRYEQYEISFNFKMEYFDENDIAFPGQGVLHMYYFNAEGYGFRINDIGDPNLTTANLQHNGYTPEAVMQDVTVTDPVTGVTTTTQELAWWRVTKIVGIGDGSSNIMQYDPNLGYNVPAPGTEDYAYSEFENGFSEALRNTLVIRKDSDGESTVSAWIDDVSMRRVFPLEIEGDNYVDIQKTLTYSEDVNGWTSFKSFIPEQGLSLSKKYFTIKDGYLHRHYMPMKYDETLTEWQDCLEHEAENYNYFYLYEGQNNYESSITGIFNIEPNVVKNFNTLNYEGTQSYVKTPLLGENINSYNSEAYANNSDIKGWKCDNISTDLDHGTLNHFVKKEGKWFGYIKGKAYDLSLGGKIDTSKFSVQGLGIPNEITPINP
jgi:hypothetical protein